MLPEKKARIDLSESLYVCVGQIFPIFDNGKHASIVTIKEQDLPNFYYSVKKK